MGVRRAAVGLILFMLILTAFQLNLILDRGIKRIRIYWNNRKLKFLCHYVINNSISNFVVSIGEYFRLLFHFELSIMRDLILFTAVETWWRLDSCLYWYFLVANSFIKILILAWRFNYYYVILLSIMNNLCNNITLPSKLEFPFNTIQRACDENVLKGTAT